MTYLYQPCYCEENIWHLCRHAELADRDRRVVLVTNPMRIVPMCEQQGSQAGELIAWDYHVILLVATPAGWEVWDPNSLLGMPQPFDRYMERSFPCIPNWDLLPLPRFRAMSVEIWEESFSSDRSHMRDAEGKCMAPPPAWPPIYDPAKGMTLPTLLDCEVQEPAAWLDGKSLIERFGDG